MTMSAPKKCDICHTNEVLYHCPRCSTSTCSLRCCKAHKTTLKDGRTTVVCNGKRDRTAFRSLNGFDDAQLASDYHFLEDVLNLSEGSKRLYEGIAPGSSGASTKRPKWNKGTQGLDSIFSDVPAHPLLQAKDGKGIVEVIANGIHDEHDITAASDECKALTICSPGQATALQHNRLSTKTHNVDVLVRQAELKGINLLRMPNGMSRRSSNTSKYNKKSDTITWKIELVFYAKQITDSKSDDTEPHRQGKEQLKAITVESSCMETTTLAEELAKHLDILPGNSARRSTLKSFVSIPRESLLLFMKSLPCRSSDPKYILLDPNVTLADTLRGKTVIEFPTVEVVGTEDKDNFSLFIDVL